MSEPSAEVVKAIRRLICHVKREQFGPYAEATEDEKKGHIYEAQQDVQSWLDARDDESGAAVAKATLVAAMNNDEEDGPQWVVIDQHGNYVKHAITGTWYDRDEAWAFAKEIDGQVRCQVQEAPDDD